jgi:hypothetical protein
MDFCHEQFDSVLSCGGASFEDSSPVELFQPIPEALFAIDLTVNGARDVDSIEEEAEFLGQLQVSEVNKRRTVDDRDSQLFLR